jgi:hypothetical protein
VWNGPPMQTSCRTGWRSWEAWSVRVGLLGWAGARSGAAGAELDADGSWSSPRVRTTSVLATCHDSHNTIRLGRASHACAWNIMDVSARASCLHVAPFAC